MHFADAAGIHMDCLSKLDTFVLSTSPAHMPRLMCLTCGMEPTIAWHA